MSDTRDLLLEIGCEELPASFVEAALRALPELVHKKLTELRLAHGSIRALGTPRRLAVLVTHVAERQPDLEEDVTGPPTKAAFKDGVPTKAAEAFASKIGCSVADLRRVETPKGEYLVGTRREAGQAATNLLADALASIITAIPFRKSMRWGTGEFAFGRPMHWIVALFGEDIVPVEVAGITSGRTSRGHRFLAPETISLARADAYVDTLRAAHVLVDPSERARVMHERLLEAAKAAGGSLIEDEFLIGENLSLVEEPHVIIGGYGDEFLELPERVILAVAKGHQRYFGVRGADGALLPKYLSVVNTALVPENIRRGNDRVMRARLSDARFFYREDVAVPMADRRTKLGGIVFQKRLGTMLGKASRIERLARELGLLLSLPEATVMAAASGAHLAKCDLVSLMVGEFPELEGEMGRAYALKQGVNPEVAHESMAGLSFFHAVAQAMESGKLFHIDLNAQRIGRYDQDLRFGSEDVRQAFLLVRLLEGTMGGERYRGPRHFDAHAYRTEDEAGVWEFAKGCMRTYKILAARAAAFDRDPEVLDILSGQENWEVDPLTAGYTREKAQRLRSLPLDPDGLARRGLRYERLDQVMMEHLLGVRH